ncbi:MAG: phosphodiester glycosidase family protein [Clostridia bacterium]|nr:phosphodiester glycosidase family protein [Clostridia bacterium]
MQQKKVLEDMKTQKKKKSRGKTVLKVFGRIGISLLTLILVLVIGIIGVLLVLYYGPSPSARDRFVLTVKETSAGGFLADWFLPKSTIDDIIAGNTVEDTDEITNTSMINIPGSHTEKGKDDPADPGATHDPNRPDDPGDDDYDINKIELIDLHGKTFRGKLLIVYNPKRVYIGTPAAYGEDKKGVSTIDMVRNNNALYGVNGGGFFDTGSGNGGVPTGRDNSDGIVISKGKMMWGNKNQTYEIIGINRDGILVLGKMTGKQALESGIVEAFNFGPYLIVNGEPCAVNGYTESSLNPRTAIGQRADGAILIVTIDGRQPTSVGASYEDLIEIMMNYGAINAANLDGGSSTYMVQNEENANNPKIITQTASLYGPRRMATSVLVARVEDTDREG